MIKKGLILEGGAMRGIFTAGVLDVFLEKGIKFDGAVGVSAGAVFGVSFKSEQQGRSLRYNLRYCRDKRYCSLYSLIKTGDLYGAEFCYYELPLRLDKMDDEAFKNNPMEFYVVATDVETGLPVYKMLSSANGDTEWVRASASMPFVSKIVEADGKKLLDGGIADSVPLEYFEKLGYNKNVVILTKPKGYYKKPNKLIPFMAGKYKKYPELIKTLKNRHLMYIKQMEYINEKEARGEIFVIRPDSALPASRVEKNPEVIKETYNLGRKKAEEVINELLRFMEKQI